MGCCGSTHSQFVKDCLQKHNEFRSLHGSPPLKIAKDLTRYSQQWADHLANANKLEHSSATLPSGVKVGENLYTYWSSDPTTEIEAGNVVQSWYDEIHNYNFNNGTFTSNTGHFTQVVWKDSLELGAGIAKSSTGAWYVVANYRPAGNVIGQFSNNVLPKR